MKYKIRFHLAQGVNFQKWQIRSSDGEVQFYEPSEVTIFMHGCKLHNNTNMAQKIFDGAHKEVCAWVEAEDVTVVMIPTKNIMDTSTRVLYNPKVSINWRREGKNVDGESYQELFTSNRHIIKGK
jgi:hypothetical protein